MPSSVFSSGSVSRKVKVARKKKLAKKRLSGADHKDKKHTTKYVAIKIYHATKQKK